MIPSSCSKLPIPLYEEDFPLEASQIYINQDHLTYSEDPEYGRLYLRDMHALFSEKILRAFPGSGDKKQAIYRPIHYKFLDRAFFLEIEERRGSPISAGGFGRGSVSASQTSFNQLLFDVVKETIHDSYSDSTLDFHSESVILDGLSTDQKRRRLPISLANFISRIEGVVLKVFFKVPEQKQVPASVYFARSSEARMRAKEAIAVQSQSSIEQMIDSLAANEFEKWLAQPDLHVKFYEEFLALDLERDGALLRDFQILREYCAQLEALPIGSEGVFTLLGAICAIKDRIVASLGSFGLDADIHVPVMRECGNLVENGVKKHGASLADSRIEAAGTPFSLGSVTEASFSSLGESQEISPPPQEDRL